MFFKKVPKIFYFCAYIPRLKFVGFTRRYRNLEYVDGYLYLSNTSITSLGNLEYVDGSLFLQRTKIASLDNLKYVGKNLLLSNTPLAKTHTIEELEEMYPQFKGKFII